MSDMQKIKLGDTVSSWASKANTNFTNLKTEKVDTTRTIAGVDLVDNITDSELRNAINVADGAQANVIEKIQKNGSDLEITNKVVNITVPTQASDVNALPSSTKYGASIDLTINSTTYVVTAQLKDQDGNNLGNAKTIDLPLESIVTSATYYNSYTYDGTTYTKVIVLVLSTTSVPTIIPVGDLISGLQNEITNNNKLSADLVDDTLTTNKFVTANDKTTWDSKQDAISDLNTIRSGASAGASAVQPGDLATVATSGKYSDLTGIPTLPPGTYIGTGTNWGTSPGVCYLRTNYFSGGVVPTKEGDLVYSTGTSNLHRCGAVTWDTDQDCYKTTPTFVANFTIPTNVEQTTNKVTSLSSASTDTEYPSAKCVYDIVGDIETLLSQV